MSSAILSNPQVEQPRVCGNCKSTAAQKQMEKLKKCARCKIELYCGRTCQRSHWPEHKKVCKVNNSTPVDKKISVSFQWVGPSRSSNFDLWVGIIDLNFPSPLKWEVSIPENNKTTTSSFSFRCQKYYPPRMCKTLELTVEQIKALTLTAGFFEPGRPIGPKIMDMNGKITQQETLRRTDETLTLALPKTIEPDQHYSIQIISNNLSLSAQLLKIAHSSSEHAEQLEENLANLFIKYAISVTDNFRIRLSSRTGFFINMDLPKFQESIRHEISNLDAKKLESIVSRTAPLRLKWEESQATKKEREIESDLRKLYVEALSAKELPNMIRSHLEKILRTCPDRQVRLIDKAVIGELMETASHEFVQNCITGRMVSPF